jgi:hypothetical protein
MTQSPLFGVRVVVTVIVLFAELVSFGQVQGMQTFDNRREGTNIHPNALQDFNIIAVHREYQSFGPHSTLHVRFYLPRVTDSENRQVFLEATELQDSFHYFMEARSTGLQHDSSWNVFEPWPTQDVIDRLGLHASNIGVRAGYRINNDPPVFLPVDVYQSIAPSSSGVYRFYFITASDLQSLDVAVVNDRGAALSAPKFQQKCNKAYNPNCKLYAAGSTNSFSLDMSALPEGVYHIRLLGRVPSSLTPTSFDLALYHPHS